MNVSSNVRVLRDPMRGGLATTLNEIANESRNSILLYEENIPVKDEVRSMCEILGLDPLYVANEGKVVVIVASEDAYKVLKEMRKDDPMGKDAQIVGEVIKDNSEKVYLKTEIGGTRMLNMPAGELLPRIC